MGSVIFSTQDFYDQTSELVGIKSGLLLSDFSINKILKEKFEDPFLNNLSEPRMVRLRAEEIEMMIKHIRVRIGNIPPPPKVNHFHILSKYLQKLGGFEIYHDYLNYACKQTAIGLELSYSSLKDEISKGGPFPEEFVESLTYSIMEKVDDGIVFPPSYTLDGATPLQSLFDHEAFPLSKNTFIDQKFIDYLGANGNEIEEIHWRNFERFVAEYFHRKGLTVDLGSGQNDGGIDIRVFNERKSSDPLIVIQCKRYHSEHKVSIETVKAFHSDVVFEKAKLGLVATTSKIASGGKKVVEARSYNISFVEKEKVKKWAKSMWALNN